MIIYVSIFSVLFVFQQIVLSRFGHQKYLEMRVQLTLLYLTLRAVQVDGLDQVIRDLKQLGRERQRRRLLNFSLSIFPLLVCITRSFLFRFA